VGAAGRRRHRTGQPASPALSAKQIPAPEVVQRLIAATEQRCQPILAAAIAVAATTGLRRGELAGLRWCDIDFDHGRLHVRQSIKNDWADDAGVAVDPNGYVLTLDPSGVKPMRPDALTQGFTRICRATGVSLLTLRHFSASMLIGSGRDVRTIAGRLGHSDASTTLRVYAHIVEGRDQVAADILGGLLAAGKPTALNNVEDLGFQRGHRTLHIGKGNKPAMIPLVPRAARTIDLAVGERHQGPIICRQDGQRLDGRTAHRWVRSIGKRAGLGAVHPHMLRAGFIMASFDAGVPLRDVQEAASHADPRTTMIYDRRRENFDRHAAYVVVAFVAGG
jgi:integrase